MSIVIAILIFSVIIIIHELGHFILAKRNGICVTEFSIGMGPRIVSTVKGETRYSIKLLPFGGSCMMLGEDEEVTDNEGAFGKKGVWARISVIAAGPIFNFILAFVLALILIGIRGYDPATISRIDTNSPAYEAGLRQEDLITKVNGSNIDISRDYAMYFQFDPLSEAGVTMEYERDGQTYETIVQPKIKDIYMLGFTYIPKEIPAQVEAVAEDSPLFLAGLAKGDIVTEVNGIKITTGKELARYMKEHPLTQEVVQITYLRNGKETQVSVEPKLSYSGYSIGMEVDAPLKKTTALGVIKYSFVEVKFWIKTTIKSLGQLITGKLSKDDLAGPVGVVDLIGDTYQATKSYGVMSIFLSLSNLCILLSANLGVMNLLPIPALDGGRLIFLFLEVIRGGKKIPQEKEGMIHMIGLVALMILMIFVMFNDISRLF